MRKAIARGAAMGGVADFWFGPRAERSKMRGTLSLTPDTVTIVSVAKLTRYSGHLVTLAGLSKLHFSIRDRLRWLVIGADGERGYVEELKAKISVSDCDVRLMGALSAQQIRDIYGASDLFCLMVTGDASGSVKEFGPTYLEAAACGLPSVATVAGAGDAVIDNETGRLAEPSAHAIADAIAELAMDGIKRVSLGKRAWMHARAVSQNRSSADAHLSLTRGAPSVRNPETAHTRPIAGAPE